MTDNTPHDAASSPGAQTTASGKPASEEPVSEKPVSGEECGHITVLVIPAEGDAELRNVVPDLSTMQGLVGGMLEPLRMSNYGVLYINEEGKFAGLDPNRWATVLTRHLDVGMAPDDFIVGTAVAVGITTSTGAYDGADHDVPERTIEVCRTLGMQIRDARHDHTCP